MIRVALLLLSAVLAAGAATLPATVDLRVDKKPLFSLLRKIARQCDAGLLVDHGLAATMERETTIAIADAPWAEAMNLLETDYHLTLTLSGGRLVVGEAGEEARKRLVRAVYEVATLTATIRDFPGTGLELPMPGASGSRLMPPIEPNPVPELNELVELVQRTVAPGTWGRSGVAIADYNGTISVTQSPEVQAQVRASIAGLERVAARQVVVRSYHLAAGTAVPGPVLAAVDWQRLAPAAGAPVAVFVVLDEQANHHFSGVRRAYIADADVNQEVLEPIIAQFTSGLLVDVHPQVLKDGVLLGARLQASSQEKLAAAVIADGRGTTAVTLDLPESVLDENLDSRLIPSGGAAVYGSGDRLYAVTADVQDYAKAP